MARVMVVVAAKMAFPSGQVMASVMAFPPRLVMVTMVAFAYEAGRGVVAIVLFPPDAFTGSIQRMLHGPALAGRVASIGGEMPVHSSDSSLVPA